MNWDAIGAAGEVLGALAVIVTLAYLASQVKQTRVQIRDQLGSTFRNTVFDAYAPVYEGDNARIFHTGLVEPERLEAHEAYVFDLLMWRHSAAVSVMKDQHEEGHMSDDAYASMLAHYRHTIYRYPGARAWVARLREATLNETVFDDLLQND